MTNEDLARKGTDKLLKRGEFLTFPVNPEVVAKYFLEVIQEAVEGVRLRIPLEPHEIKSVESMLIHELITSEQYLKALRG